jgi:uncharacterized protein YjbK
MAPHTEIETKLELDEAGFERLKTLGRVASKQDQLNVYYDCGWRLADAAATCRVRFCGPSDPVLTVKVPVSHSGEQRVMREFDAPVGAGCEAAANVRRRIDVRVDLPGPVSEALLALSIDFVERVGWVRNRRWVLIFDAIGEIELDELRLPDGTTVFESEIEADDPSVHEALATFIRREVPSARPSKLSKFQRFRQAVDRMSSLAEISPIAG